MQKRWIAILLSCVLLLTAGGSKSPGTSGEVPPPVQPDTSGAPAASSGTPPVQESVPESRELADFRAAIAGEDAQIAVAYLGYAELGGYEELTAYLENGGFYEKYPFLTGLEAAQFVQQPGGDLYVAVPTSKDIALTVCECSVDEKAAQLVRGNVLVQLSAGQFAVLQGNVSEIAPNLWITAGKDGAALLEYAPCLSMMDGSVDAADGVYDFSDYDHLRQLWEKNSEAGSCVSVHYAKDVDLRGVDYDRVVVDETAPTVEAVFCTMVPVESFAVVSLSLQDVSADGSVRYESAELFAYGTLTPDCPLSVTLTIYGDLPTYGISFVDPDGVQRLYGVTVSGMDGSLELSEIC